MCIYSGDEDPLTKNIQNAIKDGGLFQIMLPYMLLKEEIITLSKTKLKSFLRLFIILILKLIYQKNTIFINLNNPSV
jgi:hypothetical protein